MISLSSLPSALYAWMVLTVYLGLLWRFPSRSSLRHRHAHPRRPSPPHILRPLRTDPSRTLQYYCSQCAKRCNWKEQILRRHTYPHFIVHCCVDGLLGQSGLDFGEYSDGILASRDRVGVSSRDWTLCFVGIHDDE